VDDGTATIRKRFRWQTIPGTIQIFFGSIGLLSGPLLGLIIWHRYQKGLGTYSEPDVPYWCGYAVVSTIVYALILLVGGIQWFRGRNRNALILTIIAIALWTASSWWLTSRFPDL
jgi:hypothetical protein